MKVKIALVIAAAAVIFTTGTIMLYIITLIRACVATLHLLQQVTQ